MISSSAFCQSISFNPNPFSRYLKVTCEECDTILNVEIYDGYGKPVFKQLLSDTQRLDLINIPDGIYQIYIKSDGEVTRYRITKSIFYN